MRALRSAIALFVFLIAAQLFAADLKVRVLDPSSSAVAGARVSLIAPDGRILAVATSNNLGLATFTNVSPSTRVQVLAQGFAPNEVIANSAERDLTVRLKLALQTESVVVTADATALTAEKAGAATSSLDARTLSLLNLPELADNLRFMPGVYLSDMGQRGGLTTMFVRGGKSTDNKIQIDGVPVNEATGSSGAYNFALVPSIGIDRVEMVRGAESTLYGADAMTSTTQLWSATGRSRVPELRFGAEGGTFSTARGFTSLAGAQGRYDYNLYADQSNSDGQGVNGSFSGSTQGANLGMQISNSSALRLRLRHYNARVGTPGDWDYAAGSIAPDADAYGRQNDFIGSLALTFAPTSNWQNTITSFEYNHQLLNRNSVYDLGRVAYGYPYEMLSDSRDHFNRAGFDYQGEVAERAWARSVFGFRFEDENVYLTDPLSYPPIFAHGLRRNTALFGEQLIDWKRLTLTAGLRWEHNEDFGDHAVPRVTASLLALRGGHLLSGTRLRASYSEGLKAPTFEEIVGVPAWGVVASSGLKPEHVNGVETGLVQSFFDRRWSLTALYFHNRFNDQINYVPLSLADPRCVNLLFCNLYVNADHTTTQGAELELQGRVSRSISLSGSYTYTNITSTVPSANLRRPKQIGSMLATYTGKRWGASLGGSFVGRRTDNDYVNGLSVVDPGYARFDLSGYRVINRYITAFATVQNALNHKYQEVAGYPALKANFRAGLRFRVGGE